MISSVETPRYVQMVLARCNVDRSADSACALVWCRPGRDGHRNTYWRSTHAFIWTGFDVDGRDVTLKGIAPDPDTQSAARDALEKVRGLREITDLTSVLPLVSPYQLQIKKSADGIVLSGSVPDNDVRDRIMTMAENAAPGIPLDDEMAVGRGSPANFVDSVEFALQLVSDLTKGRSRCPISISRSRARLQTMPAIERYKPN